MVYRNIIVFYAIRCLVALLKLCFKNYRILNTMVNGILRVLEPRVLEPRP
jgi:hypothetical protein